MNGLTEVGKLSVSRKWKEFQEIFWGEFEQQVSAYAAGLVQEALDAEIEQRVRAKRYQRSESRCGYRNGYRERAVVCAGRAMRVRVPQTRQGFSSELLPRYRRRAEEIDAAIAALYVMGLSTRKVTRVIKSFLKVSLSAQTVSNIVSRLDARLKEARWARIEDRYVALIADGFCIPIDGCGKRRWNMLYVLGIDAEGAAEIVGFLLAPSEGEQHWEALLNDLYRRGLEGENLRLVCHDGAGGLKGAVELVWPYAQQQRCVLHKVMNVQGNLKRRSYRSEILKDAAGVYNRSRSAAEAWRALEKFIAKWQDREPKAVKCFSKDFHYTLSYFEFPRPWWRLIRTTNMLERFFRELRRRVKPVDSFKNTASAERLLFALNEYANQFYFPKNRLLRAKLPTISTAPTAKARSLTATPWAVEMWTTSDDPEAIAAHGAGYGG
jgi:putative transposase